MICIFNTDLKLTKEDNDLFTVSIEGSLYLRHVARRKTPSAPYYFLLERSMLYIIRYADGKMVAKCEIKDKSCLREDCIHGTWDVYKPAVTKRAYR